MQKQRKVRKHGRFGTNPDPHTDVHITISEKLLKEIEDNVEGESRSAKLSTCAKLGYLQLTTAISEEISESE